MAGTKRKRRMKGQLAFWEKKLESIVVIVLVDVVVVVAVPPIVRVLVVVKNEMA